MLIACSASAQFVSHLDAEGGDGLLFQEARRGFLRGPPSWKQQFFSAGPFSVCTTSTLLDLLGSVENDGVLFRGLAGNFSSMPMYFSAKSGISQSSGSFAFALPGSPASSWRG